MLITYVSSCSRQWDKGRHFHIKPNKEWSQKHSLDFPDKSEAHSAYFFKGLGWPWFCRHHILLYKYPGLIPEFRVCWQKWARCTLKSKDHWLISLYVSSQLNNILDPCPITSQLLEFWPQFCSVLFYNPSRGWHKLGGLIIIMEHFKVH